MYDARARNRMVEHALEHLRGRVERLCREVLEVQRRRHERNAPEHVRLSYANQPAAPDQLVRDIRGDSIEDDPFRAALRVVLLIDPWPHANWGHECWVATLNLAATGDHDAAWQTERQFPPQESDHVQLVPYAAYTADGLTLFYPPEPRSER